jgi:tetratricopeptide (TPR) repeat protein
MRRVFLLLFFLVIALGVSAQDIPAGFDLSNYGVRIEPDRRLIVILAALEMASMKNANGVDEKLINTPLSERNAKFREKLLADNASLPEDLRRRISMFVSQYRKRRPQATEPEITSPFISMAYTLTAVPELADPIITHDLPGSLLDVLDFAPLAREFYRKSTISEKLDDYVKEYRSDADGVLRTSARSMVSELLDYLHTRPQLVFTEKIKIETSKAKSKAVLTKIETREHDRHFLLVPEKLAPKGNVNFLNIRDDYFVILPPDADLSFSETRRAFLQFVLDPVILKNSKEIAAIRDWTKTLLDERRKTDPSVSPDVFLTLLRSLVAAVDVRQTEYTQLRIATDQSRQKIARMTTDAEKRAVSADLEKFKAALADETSLKLYEDYEKGLVLTFYFAEQLRGIEDSGFDIASSLREMIATFDPVKETKRVADSEPARQRAVAAREERRLHPENRIIAENPVTTRLLEIQKVIDAKDYTKAEADLKQLSAQNPAEPRIYFNIGRVAGLQAGMIEDSDAQARKLIDAKEAYVKVLNTATASTDKALLSLTYVALGRIYEFNNERDYAIKIYDQAIRLGDVGGYQEAIAAKQRLLRPQ